MIDTMEHPTLDAMVEQGGGREYLEDFARQHNRVMVMKHQLIRPAKWGRAIRQTLEVDALDPVVHLPMVVKLDQLRALQGDEPRYVRELLEAAGIDLRGLSTNLRTTVGIDYVADSLGKSASRPAVAEFIAVSQNATAPAAGDTTLTSEETTGGLARAAATYNHTGGATSYTLAKTFTASATFSTLQKAGLFNAASVGTLVLENTFTSTALASGDQLTITWTVNI